MARRTRRKAKSKPEVTITLVVATEDDDALDAILESAEEWTGELTEDYELYLTFAASIPPVDDEEEEEYPEDDDDDVDEDEDEEDEDDEEEDEEEEDEEEEEEDGEYMTLADLKKMKVGDLKALAKEYGIKVKASMKKSDIIDAIIEEAGEE